MKRLIILFILILATGLYAGMIELTDDDQEQFIFGDIDPNWIDSIHVYYSVDLDSGFYHVGLALNDSIDSRSFGYCRSDVDENDNLIPGIYDCQYWKFDRVFLRAGGYVDCVDTTHMSVYYEIPSGCGTFLRID